MKKKVFKLEVLKKEQVSAEAVSLLFKIPLAEKKAFHFKPGQFLTIIHTLEGETLRRSYSICNDITENSYVQIGVKKVKNGRMSRFLNEEVKVGDHLAVEVPMGRFTAELDSTQYKSYYFFAAGSGITPILSMVKSVLSVEPYSRVYVLYGNRNQEQIMFKGDLEILSERFADRFTIIYLLSQPIRSWSELWSTKTDFVYRKGRVDAINIAWFIKEYPPYAQNALYFICGPGSMIANTKARLLGMDVPENRIAIERFGNLGTEVHTQGGMAATAKVYIDEQVYELKLKQGNTILKALLNSGATPPYSCEGGVCGACACKLVKGAVLMANNSVLTEEELNAGWILSCQSTANSEKLEVVFEREK
jgi:ring-1,2-phenylacetyl-CoA epoxidase subunit PaaE